jgi:hypothetical protein
MKHLRTKVIGYTMILALLGASMIALLVELRFEREYWILYLLTHYTTKNT